MLKLTDIHVNYGSVQALKGVTIEVPQGKIVTLLGANGAGKSTLLKTISRLVEIKQGNYEFQDQIINKKSPNYIVKNQIIHCPENRRIFPELTVEENLQIGAYLRKDKEQIKKDRDKVLSYFPRLSERMSQHAGTLSGGEQQMLAIGRSLMGDPKILLLDEPSLGLAPNLVRSIFDIIKKINEEDGLTILLVEQNAHLALEVADYAYILENGIIQLSGESKDLKKNDKVRELYLGA
ncbi:ABC transporter ATP-binding protein [Oceanobacillus sp. CF4.6]|uniref:ABC transporter ATP-binding protein n=1 Tax=Oceanobacillus sp. CF4.6 TaxID=3373080 RepID=UPI003EE58F36